MAGRRSDTAERIIREAMRLFAQKGYERTSIADIQAAAGLAPGSGALYKHFSSKEAVLRAGVDNWAEAATSRRDTIPGLPSDLQQAFSAMARLGLDLLAEDREAVKIAWRELDQFPDLLELARERRMQATFRLMAKWLADRSSRGELRVSDPEATAAVLVGSLSFFRVFEIIMHTTPNGVDEERFVNAWVATFRRALEPD